MNMKKDMSIGLFLRVKTVFCAILLLSALLLFSSCSENAEPEKDGENTSGDTASGDTAAVTEPDTVAEKPVSPLSQTDFSADYAEYAKMLEDEAFVAFLTGESEVKVDFDSCSSYFVSVSRLLYGEYGAKIQRETGVRRGELRDQLISMLASVAYSGENGVTYENVSEKISDAISMPEESSKRAALSETVKKISEGGYDKEEIQNSLDGIFDFSLNPNDPSGEPSDFTGEKLTLVWSDEFDGKELDKSVWSYRSCGSQEPFGDIGNIDDYLLDHIYFYRGKMIMAVDYFDNKVLHPNDPDYCGEQNISNLWIDTKGKFTQKFGYFEMCCILGEGSGSNCSFWMVAGDPWEYNSESSKNGVEIDVFESVPGWADEWSSQKVEATVHWQHNTPSKSRTNTYVINSRQETCEGMKIPVDFFDGEYHTFGVLWTEKEYAFFYDGYEVYRTDCTENGGNGVCDKLGYLLISSHFMNPDWYGKSDPSGYPYDFTIDYVRAYQLDEYIK